MGPGARRFLRAQEESSSGRAQQDSRSRPVGYRKTIPARAQKEFPSSDFSETAGTSVTLHAARLGTLDLR